VASRSIDRANAFADRFDVPKRYAERDALLGDPDVDAVYVATPHASHEDDTVAALSAGKHVLCEKPFALNVAQATRMATEARTRRLFCMEAMWSRFLPAYRSMVDTVRSGRIGVPLVVDSDFGFRAPFDPAGRLFDLSLGGGALLDVGIYPVQLCMLVLGPIERIISDGVIGETGADEQVAAVLRHASGALGVIRAATRLQLACAARISGTDGAIEFAAPAHCPRGYRLITATGVETVDCGFEGHGLRFEVAEVHRCIGAGLTESPLMPLDETIALATALDSIRATIGVRYPGE
jgi:predicted dehydrogenase